MLKQFLRDEQGQTTVEYLLIIAVIVVVISAFGNVMQSKIKDVVNTVMNGVNAKIGSLMKAAN